MAMQKSHKFGFILTINHRNLKNILKLALKQNNWNCRIETSSNKKQNVILI
jgi:hypothetical protein